VHRKSWEWTQCLFGLDCLGGLRPEHRALGVGVGWEPLSFFLSNHVGEVVATDLYPEHGHWSDAEGNREIVADPDKFAPFPYRRDRLRFLAMDGKKLDFPDASFDLVWSCSSIEHFGVHAGSAESVR
jgi:cyclopropane fatty-acyl-phospholipid synthase-like methyltransferase